MASASNYGKIIEQLAIEASNSDSLKSLVYHATRYLDFVFDDYASFPILELLSSVLNTDFITKNLNKLSKEFPDKRFNHTQTSIIRLLLWYLRRSLFFVQRGVCNFIDFSSFGNLPFEQTGQGGKTYAPNISIAQHTNFIQILGDFIRTSEPSHIYFPGERSCYMQLSGISLENIDNFTLTIWANFDPACHDKFEMCKCRSQHGGIDVIFSDHENSNNKWTVTIKSNNKYEKQCSVKVTPNTWNLFTISHCKNQKSTLVFSLNGTPIMSDQLMYPFASVPSIDWKWMFGIGFHGMIASCSLYNNIIDKTILKLLFEQGPTYCNVHQAYRCPSYSTESSFVTQGTILSKGFWAKRALKLTLVFSLSVDIFNESSSSVLSTPQKFPGALSEAYTELGIVSQDTERDTSAFFAGNCKVNNNFHIQKNFPELGGSFIWLYYLWIYCNLLKDNHLDESQTSPTSVIELVCSTLQLILYLLRSSGEFREEFLQNHGFHVIGNSLSLIRRKELIDENIVRVVVDIVYCFGIDAKNFDAIASAFQGLLFCFKVWGGCIATVKKIIIDSICIFANEKDKLLHKSMGCQNIIDILRCHIFSQPVEQREETVYVCTAACKVVRFALDHARMTVLDSSKAVETDINFTRFGNIISYLLNCLVESNNEILIEELVLYLHSLKSFMPDMLYERLKDQRYWDTTYCQIVSRQNLSQKTRQLATELLIWSVSRNYREHVTQLHELWSQLKLESLALGVEVTGSGSSRHSMKPIKTKSSETKRFYDISQKYFSTSAKLSKAWELMSFLGSYICKVSSSWQEDNHAHQTVNHDCYIEALQLDSANLININAEEEENSDQESEEYHDSTPINHNEKETSKIWFYLPFLENLLANCSFNHLQTCITTLNMVLKADPVAMEIITSFPFHQYMNVLVNMAVTNYNDSESSGNVSTDLILDMIVYTIDFKVKNRPDDCYSILARLESIVRSNALISEYEANLFLVKFITLYLHYIVKSYESNSEVGMKLLRHILLFGNSKGYCGSLVVLCGSATMNSDDLRNMSDQKQSFNSSTTSVESILCTCILEILRNYKKQSTKSDFVVTTLEYYTILLSWITIASRINELSDSILDFITTELFATIQFFIEIKNKSFLNEVQVVLLFQLMFTLLKKAKLNCSADRREKYVAVVYALCSKIFLLKDYLTSSEHHVSEFIGKFDAMKLDIATMSEFIDSKFNVEIQYQDFMDLNFLVDKNYESLDATIFEEFLITTTQVQARDKPSASASTSSSLPRTPMRPLSTHGLEVTTSSSKKSTVLASLSPEHNDRRASIVDTGSNFGIIELESDESIPDGSGALGGKDSSAPPTLDEWWKLRKGILSDRLERERLRMKKFDISSDLAIQALEKFLKKKASKLEQEIFEDKADCHWKLSVSNEGHFPGRKRIVLRPHSKYKMNQYHYERESNDDSSNNQSSSSSSGGGNSPKSGEILSMHSDQQALGAALAKVSALEKMPSEGLLILDDNEEGGVVEERNDAEKLLPVADTVSEGESSSHSTPSKLIGESWGIVDNDGTESYGVVGLALEGGGGGDGLAVSDHIHYNDMLGDLHKVKLSLIDEFKADCGPCLPGSQKVFTKDILSCPVIMITASGSIWGTISFNEKEIYFVASLEPEGGHKDDIAAVAVNKSIRMRRRKWQMVFISAIYLRRYRLRDTALEVFFKKGKHRSFFIDFGHTKENEKTREYFARQLMNYAPSIAAKQWPHTYGHFFSFVYSTGIQDKWINGELSNFDYLMMINTLAGRSFNDLCQYPIMPWVIKQYTESYINLSDPSTFRDLSKPMGALNEERLQEFLSRYKGFAENVSSEIPAFMYGSHYSTMVGVVLYFMVRLQPYAALHQEMQNGTFDVADRLFSSIPRTFLHNTTQLSEVKELTPEWFTCPDMFRNINNFDMGKTQDGERVQDVELPPWARTPEEFVRIHREALESDFVSEHLHEWIDLIFGSKQQGPAAVEANNVFFYLTYYGMVDRDKLDESLRLATELQIAHFGQMPIQIFNKPHPPKKQKSGFRIPRPIWKFNVPLHSIPPVFKMKMPTCFEERVSVEAGTMIFNKPSLSKNLIVASIVTANRIILFNLNGTIESYKFGLSDYAKSLLASVTFRRRRNSTVSSQSSSSSSSPSPAASSSSGGQGGDGDSDHNLSSHDDDSGSSRSSSQDGRRESEDTDDFFGIHFSPIEPLLYMERDSSQLDVVPRVPMCLVNGFNSVYNRTFASCFSNNIVISGGFNSGRIAVRELESYSGFIESAGDFFGHSCRVVSISSDKAPSATSILLKDSATSQEASYEMVCSIDESGVMLLWTINQVHTQDKILYLISRRPFRRYNLWSAAGTMACDICCNLNIVAALVGSKVFLFSIEREEKISEFNFSTTISSSSSPASATANATSNTGNTATATEVSSDSSSVLSSSSSSGVVDGVIGSKIAICEDGYVAVHMVLASSKHGAEGHLRVFSLTGFECARIDDVRISFMYCPPQSNLLICGFSGGFVNLYNFCNLKVLCTLNPHHDCVPIGPSGKSANINLSSRDSPSFNSPGPSSNTKSSSSSGSGSASNNGNASYNNGSAKDLSSPSSPSSVPISPIKWVSIASEPTHSAMITIVNERGDLFIKALPDFISWNNTRSPNVFVTQLISVPLQNVKDTTQNLIITTTENAAVAFQSAKSFADSALSELKKSTIGAFSSWLGGGSSSSSSSGGGGGNKDKDSK